jgi:hypothetical protein
MNKTLSKWTTSTVCCLAIALMIPIVVWAHCDTLDGPVVLSAKQALEKGEVTPVLKWVQKDDEGAVRAAFKETMLVRAKGKEAKELADRYFFETLVRIHRASEGEPYTGLKPAGAIDPAVKGADEALESGSAENLVKMLTDKVAAGARERFAAVFENKKHAEESVEAGRKFVQDYVEFTHYVERIYLDAGGKEVHHGEAEKSGGEHGHRH